MKVAIVHDYLLEFGGAERVLLALHEMYPNAPIYVLLNRPHLLGKFAEKFKDADIRQSWFGYLPFAQKLISPLRFLVPIIWSSFDLKDYDLIISSASWAVSKGFSKKSKAIEICYCHTPPRYLYGYDTSRKYTSLFGRLVKMYALIVNHFMRLYDFERAQKPARNATHSVAGGVDFFIANSQETKRRIEKFYRRGARVIYPPIDVPQKSLINNQKPVYYLAGGRLTAAKNFDVIIKALNKLNLPLKVYGDGALRQSLEKLAHNNIEFLGKVSDEKLASLYQNAKAFILASKDEDFGMTSVEAQAQGCPVIAFRGGGYLESVVDGKTGVFFDEMTPESLVSAIQQLNHITIKPFACIANAKRFSKERFKREFKRFIAQKSSLPS